MHLTGHTHVCNWCDGSVFTCTHWASDIWGWLCRHDNLYIRRVRQEWSESADCSSAATVGDAMYLTGCLSLILFDCLLPLRKGVAHVLRPRNDTLRKESWPQRMTQTNLNNLIACSKWSMMHWIINYVKKVPAPGHHDSLHFESPILPARTHSSGAPTNPQGIPSTCRTKLHICFEDVMLCTFICLGTQLASFWFVSLRIVCLPFLLWHVRHTCGKHCWILHQNVRVSRNIGGFAGVWGKPMTCFFESRQLTFQGHLNYVCDDMFCLWNMASSGLHNSNSMSCVIGRLYTLFGTLCTSGTWHMSSARAWVGSLVCPHYCFLLAVRSVVHKIWCASLNNIHVP